MKKPFRNAKFYLPKKEIELEKFACIACDQHTSDVSYWDRLDEFVGSSVSSLRLVFPEAYMGEKEAEKIASIAPTMLKYQQDDIFDAYEGMVYIERQVSNGKIRKGVLLAVDLEEYSFEKGSKPLISASEGTVLHRIPPRVKVRELCSLELPHVMLLIDDETNSVIEAAAESASETLYDFDLNFNGGHIVGKHIVDSSRVENALLSLLNNSKDKYSQELLFAVGDGNHSLAAAKQVYLNAKAAGGGEECRYAMVEVVNIYDDALEFEPIHRLATNCDVDSFVSKLQNACNDGIEHQLYCGDKVQTTILSANAPASVAFIDGFCAENGVEVDFVHGADNLKKLAQKSNSVGIELKSMDKRDFFPYIISNGSLPKKTFSMGEAEDKRYYLEVAKIK